jgi:predicted nucleotidyltransferase
MLEAATIEALRDALSACPFVALGVLFGSQATGRAHAGSDVDLAFVPIGDPPLHAELELQAALVGIAGRAVDLVRLDHATTLARWEVATTGVPLFSRFDGAWTRFQAQAAAEHADFAPALERAAARFARRLAAKAAPS